MRQKGDLLGPPPVVPDPESIAAQAAYAEALLPGWARTYSDPPPGDYNRVRERVLFIGTQFSILYTFMYSPAEAATPRA